MAITPWPSTLGRLLLPLLLCLGVKAEEITIPETPTDILVTFCLDCHDADTQKGEINLDTLAIDWKSPDNQTLWERVLHAVERGDMPPAKKDQPSEAEREAIQSWIHNSLLEQTDIGGTLARRLNRSEYLATVTQLFGLKRFELPPGFPPDQEYHGFDNVGKGLVVSPTLLEAYAETARLVADEVFPPPRKTVEASSRAALPPDMVIGYSSGKVEGDAMRLCMKSDPVTRSSTWPSRFEAPASGIYTVTVDLSTFRPDEDGPMIAKVFAYDTEISEFTPHTKMRLLKEIQVTNEAPQRTSFEAKLYEGQTPLLLWANAELDSNNADKASLKTFFANKGKANPRYLPAWKAMIAQSKGQGFRGGVGWDRVKENLKRDDLPTLDKKAEEALLNTFIKNPVLYAETVAFDVFENGPSLEVHRIQLQGPHRLIKGPKDIEREKLKHRFLKKETDPAVILRRFLPEAFRRPVDAETLALYLQLHNQHVEAGHSAEDAMHLVIRDVLISPRFLYRALKEGPLDDHDLAARLSYFLGGRPPDAKLLNLANRGTLRDPKTLQSEAERWLPRSPGAPMIVNFTGQWLDTRILPEIMPDPRFKFSTRDEGNAIKEVQAFFHTMLKENRPMTDFIDPDFTWTSGRIARDIYGLKEGFNPKKIEAFQRIPLTRGGRYGGLLGQSAIMMVTANGVDTQPVLRGVWVLENIMGMHPPPPPQAVPALTPDTQGTTTPRELLTAHTKATACAGCHKKIDPIGFALENFDPVGRWRDQWPGIEAPIDASSTLPDGTPINGIVDLKAWLVDNIDLVSQCISEKLLTYATGRVPNYSERQEIAAIVKTNREKDNGFRDLLLALIQSETFLTK